MLRSKCSLTMCTLIIALFGPAVPRASAQPDPAILRLQRIQFLPGAQWPGYVQLGPLSCDQLANLTWNGWADDVTIPGISVFGGGTQQFTFSSILFSTAQIAQQGIAFASGAWGVDAYSVMEMWMITFGADVQSLVEVTGQGGAFNDDGSGGGIGWGGAPVTYFDGEDWWTVTVPNAVSANRLLVVQEPGNPSVGTLRAMMYVDWEQPQAPTPTTMTATLDGDNYLIGDGLTGFVFGQYTTATTSNPDAPMVYVNEPYTPEFGGLTVFPSKVTQVGNIHEITTDIRARPLLWAPSGGAIAWWYPPGIVKWHFDSKVTCYITY